MQTFLTLRSYYDPNSCVYEDEDMEFQNAKSAFLDAVMTTGIMIATDTFVHDNGLHCNT